MRAVLLLAAVAAAERRSWFGSSPKRSPLRERAAPCSSRGKYWKRGR